MSAQHLDGALYDGFRRVVDRFLGGHAYVVMVVVVIVPAYGRPVFGSTDQVWPQVVAALRMVANIAAMAKRAFMIQTFLGSLSQLTWASVDFQRMFVLGFPVSRTLGR